MLKNYGHKGQSVGRIVEEMSKRGLRDFSSARNAKSSVASTCAHDTAFARVAPGTFALRAVPGVVEVRHTLHQTVPLLLLPDYTGRGIWPLLGCMFCDVIS